MGGPRRSPGHLQGGCREPPGGRTSPQTGTPAEWLSGATGWEDLAADRVTCRMAVGRGTRKAEEKQTDHLKRHRAQRKERASVDGEP